MAQFEVTKTADHTTVVGELLAYKDGSNNYFFPTVLVTSDATPIGATNAVHVQPGTGASWAVTGPLTDAQLRASAVPVSLASIPLNANAATASNQATVIAALSSIDGHVDGVEGSLTSIDAKMTACNTSAVVIASSALPTGAATAARQDTANTSLGSIDAKTPALGQALDTGSVPVVLTAAQLATLTPVSTVGLAAGTNNVGDVDVVTQPARAATTDTITAKLATDAIQNGTTALTPKFAEIAASTSGDNTIVAAVSGKKIRVLNYVLTGTAAVNARWKSGASTTKSGKLVIAAAGGGAAPPFVPTGHFETASGEALVLNLSGAVEVGGHCSYVEV